jgi:hypothetical protein
MTVLITLTTAGSNTGPFNLYSDADGFSTIITSGISRADLLAGYEAILPTGTTEVLLRSAGPCNSSLYLIVSGAPTTSTTSSTSSTTSSSSTTPNPDVYYLAQKGRYAKTDGCPLNVVLRIYLNASDYALFVANGYSFAGLGGGGPTTCTAIARNQIGNSITALFYDLQNISWNLSNGVFTYSQFQC